MVDTPRQSRGGTRSLFFGLGVTEFVFVIHNRILGLVGVLPEVRSQIGPEFASLDPVQRMGGKKSG